jgi:hypothetical protein
MMVGNFKVQWVAALAGVSLSTLAAAQTPAAPDQAPAMSEASAAAQAAASEIVITGSRIAATASLRRPPYRWWDPSGWSSAASPISAMP